MQFLQNKYVKLTLLTVGIAALIYAVVWIVFMALGINDFPVGFLLFISLGSAGLLVYKFLSGRVF